MIPISDDDSDRKISPYVNYIIIVVNILVFIFLQKLGSNDGFTYSYSTVPGEILSGHDIVTHATIAHDPVSGQDVQIPGLGVTNLPVWLTLITSMFMHGGIAHIAGNMLYLWVFGDNIENALGHVRYLIFYLLCGIIASLSHVFSVHFLAGNELIPSLGASGAISGVLGGYLLLFPKRRVNVFIIRALVPVPAYVALGFWIVLQVVSQMGLLGGGETGGGVAYAAHIGGFIAGLLLVKLMQPREVYV
ncbi:MAG: rhomboid family intramembrane serine protease [Ginsengibacter sp.]